MKTYILTKTQKGKRFLYEVKDNEGNVVAKRMSTRGTYVAATVNGKIFFGRRDLVGKGTHGEALNAIEYYKNYDANTWEKERKASLKEIRMCLSLERKLDIDMQSWGHKARGEEWFEKYHKGMMEDHNARFNPEKMEETITYNHEYAAKRAEAMKVAYLQD